MTLALRLFKGRHETKAYPMPKELLAFGQRVCDVSQPQAVLRRIGQAMLETLDAARSDERIPAALFVSMKEVWERGLAYAGPGRP